MSFQPLYDRVLVRRHEAETVTKGGIIIPDTLQEKPAMGTVTAVGTGYYTQDGALRPLTVKEGDTVMFENKHYDEVTVDGIDYVVIQEKNIMGILNATATKKKAA